MVVSVALLPLLPTAACWNPSETHHGQSYRKMLDESAATTTGPYGSDRSRLQPQLNKEAEAAGCAGNDGSGHGPVRERIHKVKLLSALTCDGG